MDISELIGATVLDTGLTEIEEDEWPFIDFRLPDGRRVRAEISRDEEGNGPGEVFLDEGPWEV